MTPDNFDKISKDILAMEVDTEERLGVMIQIFFDKAVNEPMYSPKYAKVCKMMFEEGSALVQWNRISQFSKSSSQQMSADF